MATIYDLPAKLLSEEIFSYIHYTERLTIEPTCQMFQNLMPYNDIKQLALNDPIFKNSIHFADCCSMWQAIYKFEDCGRETHEVFANRLKRFLVVLLEQKRIGSKLHSIHFYRCVINAESMGLIATYCTNLSQRLRFEDMMILDSDTVLTLPKIRRDELRSLQLIDVGSNLATARENEEEHSKLILAMNDFVTGAEKLVEFIWGNVTLPFPSVRFSHSFETVKIHDYNASEFGINLDLNAFANTTKLKHFFASDFDIIVLSPPQNLFLAQLSGLCSLTLQVQMRISGNNQFYCLTQTDINGIGNMKCLQKLRLFIYQDEIPDTGENQAQFLNFKPIGLLQKLHVLDLGFEGRCSLTFTQLKKLIWAAPLKTLKIRCSNYFVDESDNAASETNDVLEIISSRQGSTLEDLTLTASNAMENWKALATANKLFRFFLLDLQTIDDEMLKHLCAMPSLIELKLHRCYIHISKKIEVTLSNLDAIIEARKRLGPNGTTFKFSISQGVWEKPEQQEIIHKSYRKMLHCYWKDTSFLINYYNS